MTWRIPRNPIISGAPADPDDVNENFKAYVEELEGNLNEHNFAGKDTANPGFTMNHIENEAIMRPHSVVTASDGSTAPDYGVSVADEFEIPQNGQWSQVTDMVKTFEARGGGLWIMASCQLQSHRFGVQLALRVNGTLIPESVWPFADREVEFDDPGDFQLPATNFFRRSAGETARLAPAVVEAVIDIPPGPCTVELVARTAMEVRDPAAVTAQYKYSVYHRELIVIEV